MGAVSYAGKPATQLDGCGQLALLVEDGADRGGIHFGYREHAAQMGPEGPSLRKRTVRNENTGEILPISEEKG